MSDPWSDKRNYLLLKAKQNASKLTKLGTFSIESLRCYQICCKFTKLFESFVQKFQSVSVWKLKVTRCYGQRHFSSIRLLSRGCEAFSAKWISQYSRRKEKIVMAHNGHLYEMEILLKWTPRVGPRPAPAFLYSLNLFDSL